MRRNEGFLGGYIPYLEHNPIFLKTPRRLAGLILLRFALIDLKQTA